MTTFNGKCHCGQTEWTVELPKDSQAHILWYVLRSPTIHNLWMIIHHSMLTAE